MALTVINDPYASKSASIGADIGAGIGEGLQYLLQQKLQNMQQQQQQKRLYQAGLAANMTPQQAQFYSMLPEKQGATFLSGWAQTPQAQMQAMQTGGQLPQAQLPMTAMQQMQMPQQQQQRQPLQELIQAAAKPLSIPELLDVVSPRRDERGQEMTPDRLTPLLQQLYQQQQEQQMVPQQPQMQQQAPISTAEIYAKGLETPQMRLQRELAERKLAQQRDIFEEKTALEETRDERKKIIADYKDAKKTLEDLDRFEELEQSGELDTPGYVEFLKRSGLDIPALLNPQSQEFEKIAANFLRDAKTYFGGRISNYEVEQFLKTIPSLSQSPEGRKRVIANLKKLQRGKVAYYDTYRQIMKKNKNKPPFDLAEQVLDEAEPELIKISKKFKQDLAKPVPEGHNKFITGIMAAAGSILGAPGSLLGGAGKLAAGLGSLI